MRLENLFVFLSFPYLLGESFQGKSFPGIGESPFGESMVSRTPKEDRGKVFPGIGERLFGVWGKFLFFCL